MHTLPCQITVHILHHVLFRSVTRGEARGGRKLYKEIHHMNCSPNVIDVACGLAVRVPGATDPEVRVQFPPLPDLLRSSGSGTGSTQTREYS
jgi:hypothetical protein